jgi:hypothetical protein
LFGEVAEVSLARKYDGKLFLYKKRSELTIKLETAIAEAHAKGQATSKEILKIQKEIVHFDRKIAKKNQESNVPSNQLPVRCAYVTFSKHDEMTNCKDIYKEAKSLLKSQPLRLAI